MSATLSSCLSPAVMSPFSVQLYPSPMANSSTSQNGSGLLSLIFAGQAKSSWVRLNWSIAKASWQPLLKGCQEGRLLRFPLSLGRFSPSLVWDPCWAPVYRAGFWLQTVCPGLEMEWTTESFFAAGSASDLFGSWEMPLLSIFSDIKVLGIPPQIIHCNFFGQFLIYWDSVFDFFPPGFCSCDSVR